MDVIDRDELLNAAHDAPSWRFAVGVALLTSSGAIFTGINVENVSLGLTMRAERSAVSAAIAGGTKEFVAIGVVADSDEPAIPCGACRQVLAEFDTELLIVTSTIAGRTHDFQLNDLLPRPRQGVLEGLPDV